MNSKVQTKKIRGFVGRLAPFYSKKQNILSTRLRQTLGLQIKQSGSRNNESSTQVNPLLLGQLHGEGGEGAA
jgi:hypothetical protein